MASRPARKAPAPDVVRTRVFDLPRRFRPDIVNGLVAQWELRVDRQVFTINVGGHSCRVEEGPGATPNTTIWVDGSTWLAIDDGTLTGPQAFLDHRLQLTGNLDLAVRLQTLFRPHGRARRAADLDQVEITADGIRLSAYVMGKGRPVLLLHGLGGSKISWIPLLGPLSEAYQVVVPDLPGHGESEKPRVDYTPRFYARVVRHLMDELGAERTMAVGNSMGGRVALELALRSPNRVESLALLDAALPGIRWRALVGFGRIVPTEFASLPLPLRERWMRTMLGRMFAHPERLAPETIGLAARDFLRIYADPRARVAFLSSLRHLVTEPGEAFWQSMRRVKQPALVIVGEHDRVVPSRLGLRLADHLPNAELLVLPDVGHVPQFEATGETLEPLLSFLARSHKRAARR
jgi:pimeloyl-ACP methyl ester carboxylesterase